MTKEEKIKDLRAWLKSANMSQSEFARKINAPLRTVQNWCGGQSEITDYLYFLIDFWFEHKKVDSLKER